jgi:ubiquinone/menaquinone biosynthesis C-methylase UbiE
VKDRFSNHASQYAAFRPSYPKELYDFLMINVKKRSSAWDVGCGNGQVAKDLATHFEKVFATDISSKQIENAVQVPNIFYSICPADKSPFPDSSFDLITVAQALHWFTIPEFFTEAERVSKPGGLIAVWGYGLLKIDSSIDPIVADFYTNVIGPYWDAERKLVDQHYQTIPFPFQEFKAPTFQFSFSWSLEEFRGYLTTWSSVQKYLQQHATNPVDDVIEKIKPVWGVDRRVVSFPLFLRIGKVKKS